MRDVPAVTFLPIESKLAHPAVPKSDSVPSSHAQKENDSPQTAPVLPLAPNVSQNVTNLSNAVSSYAPGPPSNTVPNANAGVFANAVPGVLPDAVQKAVPSVFQVPLRVQFQLSHRLPFRVLF